MFGEIQYSMYWFRQCLQLEYIKFFRETYQSKIVYPAVVASNCQVIDFALDKGGNEVLLKNKDLQ